MAIIDGKLVAKTICDQLQQELITLNEKNINCHLVIIQVGDVYASNIYVKNKQLVSERVGLKTTIKKFPETITQEELIGYIVELNDDHSVNGILVQLPLPKHINETLIIATINPNKDVDCFHLNNVGKLWTARKTDVKIKPCTPAGIIELLKYYKIPIAEKKAVIIGRSNIVGKPMASLLLLEDATVTLCHSRTTNLHQICSDADILISAIGKPNIIDETYIKQGATVIDVAINRDPITNKICGDIQFEKIKHIASYITPVPGGVGPMTVVMLMKNLIELTKIQHNL